MSTRSSARPRTSATSGPSDDSPGAFGHEGARERRARDEAERAGQQPQERLDGVPVGVAEHQRHEHGPEQGGHRNRHDRQQRHRTEDGQGPRCGAGRLARDRGQQRGGDRAREVEEDLGGVDRDRVDAEGRLAGQQRGEDLVGAGVEEVRQAADPRPHAEAPRLAQQREVARPMPMPRRHSRARTSPGRACETTQMTAALVAVRSEAAHVTASSSA